jgi:hypothetical protein
MSGVGTAFLEPDLSGDMARARDLMELVEGLEAICTRERE